ncbi:MAG: TolC family protein, partial [Aestuariivirgaceae bacterium]
MSIFTTTQLTTAASAETLAQALTSAYRENPQLLSERARQRVTDEQVPQALSGWRPTVIANGDAGLQHTDTKTGAGTANTDTEPAGVSIELSQPIFRGFRTINETRRAESNIEAGRQNLLSVEQQVLFDASTAFMNVVRDRQ